MLQKSIIFGTLLLFFVLFPSSDAATYSNTIRYKYIPSTSRSKLEESEQKFYFTIEDPNSLTIDPPPTPSTSESKRDTKFDSSDGKLDSSDDKVCSNCMGSIGTSQSYVTFTIQTFVSHKISSDLTLTLTAPSSGSTAISSILVQGDGGSFSNLYNGTLFTDSATYSAADYPFKENGVVSPLKPITPLSAFQAVSFIGNWTFSMVDNQVNKEGGTLHWLEFTIQDGCLVGNPCYNGGTCASTGPTSYSCNCIPGYEGKNCTDDVNECTANPCDQNAICKNTFGSFTCQCKTGFQGDGFRCQDVNECLGYPCNKDAICTNTIGSYVCSCKTGYSGNGFNCTDINECTSGSNDCAVGTSTCTNSPGSYTCKCNTGYSGNGKNCTDIDECKLGTFICSSREVCVNTPGKYECQCKEGYIRNGTFCSDINECLSSPCSNNSDCYNADGSYTCTCKPGYEGDETCTDIDECLGQGGGNNCSEYAICTNTDSSFNCTCKTGFSGNGVVCSDINECMKHLGDNPCEGYANSLCKNTNGSYYCQCKNGFYDVGDHCEDYNECQGENGGNNCHLYATCINTPGNYTCKCNAGFSGNGISCQDIDECVDFGVQAQQGKDDCDPTKSCCDPNARCGNTIGSFSCFCSEGYFGPGTKCIVIAIPTLDLIGSNSFSISWNLSDSATGYDVSVFNSSSLVKNNTIDFKTSSFIISDLRPYTSYRVRLTTIFQTFSDYKEFLNKTYPAAISKVTIDLLTYNGVKFTINESMGAIGYTINVFNNKTRKFTQTLNVDSFEGEKTISIGDLDSNTLFIFTIFANPERKGFSFPILTFPEPPPFIQSLRQGNNSILISWLSSEGATQYHLVQKFNETSSKAFNLTNVNSALIEDLPPSTLFTFTIYSGNDNGFDLSEGTSGNFSTDTILCLSVIEDHALWFPVLTGQTSRGRCQGNYGGSPTRDCFENGAHQGEFGMILDPCVQYPEIISSINAVPKSDSVLLDWKTPARASFFRAFLVFNGYQSPVNNGGAYNFTGNHLEAFGLQPMTNYSIIIYSGNKAGFESQGQIVNFLTEIPVPPSLTAGEIGSNWVYLSWGKSDLAFNYLIEIKANQKSVKRDSEFINSDSTNYNITNLLPSTDYTIVVYAARGNDYHEPHGSSIQVTTRSVSSDQTNAPPQDLNLVGIIVGCVVGFLVLIILLIIGFVVLRKKKTRNSKRISSNTAEELISMKSGSFIPVRSSSNGETLLNTQLEISIPGFLLMTEFHKIRIEESLGKGGSGLVFKGEFLDPALVQLHSTQYVALKKVQEMPSLSPEENSDLFFQELSMMWTCSFHPNVIKLLGYFLEPEKYIVTKLYELDLLTYILHPTEDLSALQALKLANDIAAGMASIQELGIIHRDLKSPNVLLDQISHQNGQYILQAVICDFGIARISTGIKASEIQTIYNIDGLSPKYCPPESFTALTSKEEIDLQMETKRDVYSLGIIIWEMLNREVVWKNKTFDELKYLIGKGDRPAIPDSDGDDLRALLIELMQKCWSQDYHQRPTFKDINQKLNKELK